jgi:hypothetical protein
MITGIELIQRERQRQIEEENYTAETDDLYVSGELRKAAACYAVAKDFDCVVINPDNLDDIFPWDELFDKREKHSERRCLEIAGALIAAEIDRLLRLEEAMANPINKDGKE